MNNKSKLREWFSIVVIAILLSILVRTFLFEIYVVEGISMVPTLNDKERIIVTKTHNTISDYNRGDIIVIDFSKDYGKDIVKRIIAVAGDTIEICEGKVVVNGNNIAEDYLNQLTEGRYELTTVPAGAVFVMGDNRSHSLDSRDTRIGFITETQIKGKAVWAIWPPRSWHSLKN